MRSLDSLRAEKHEREIRQMEPQLRQEATSLGIANADTMEVWKLLSAVNRARDELRRDQVEARAKRLGVRTRTLLGGKREVWEISYDCYQEEDRQWLLHQLGYVEDDGGPA